MNIIKHYVCYGCDDYEDIVMSEEEDAIFEPTVTCGGCGGQMMLESQRYDFGDDGNDTGSSDDRDDDDEETPDEYVADMALRLGRGMQSYLQSQGMDGVEVSVEARGQEIDLDDAEPEGGLTSAFRELSEAMRAFLGDDDYESMTKDDPESFDWTFDTGNRVVMPGYSLLVPDAFEIDYEAERGFAAYPPDSEIDGDGVVLFPGMRFDNGAWSQYEGLMSKELYFGLQLQVYHMNMSSELVGRTYERSWEVHGDASDTLVIQKTGGLDGSGFEFYVHPYHGMDRTWFRVVLYRCPAGLRDQMAELVSVIARSIVFDEPAAGEFELIPGEFLSDRVEPARVTEHFQKALGIESVILDLQIKACELRPLGVFNDIRAGRELPEALQDGEDLAVWQDGVLAESWLAAQERSNERVVAIWSAFNDVFETQKKMGASAEDLLALVELGDLMSSQIAAEVDLSAVAAGTVRLTKPTDYEQVLSRWEALRTP